MGDASGRWAGRGITALFAGDSGTGKTMSAEAIAGDLGLELYTVNLATVVDKYVGETEKNLERIFAEASGVNAVLLFDEADAIFGKRSEVRDAHDRYANIESAYLLQRMETFDGLAVLATNLRANIDDAFTRRLDTIIDFPAPDRRAATCPVAQVPGSPAALRGRPRPRVLRVARSRCPAATSARSPSPRRTSPPAQGGPVGMAELVAAIQLEYRKLGRLVLASEFGRYHRRTALNRPARRWPAINFADGTGRGGRMGYRLGIDVGTTYTAAAVVDGRERADARAGQPRAAGADGAVLQAGRGRARRRGGRGPGRLGAGAAGA